MKRERERGGMSYLVHARRIRTVLPSVLHDLPVHGGGESTSFPDSVLVYNFTGIVVVVRLSVDQVPPMCVGCGLSYPSLLKPSLAGHRRSFCCVCNAGYHRVYLFLLIYVFLGAGGQWG